MALYTYKAVNPDGRMVLGRIDAINLVDLEMRLRRMELDLITGEPLNNRRSIMGGGVPRREIIHFCFHLQQLVRAGVPIIEGLTDLRDSLEHPRFREVVASLIESIEGGQTLSQAMESHRRVFDRVFISLIRAGETTGRLPEVLHSLNESLKWEDELASQTKKMIAYPAFVSTIVVGATFFLMVYMVPQLKMFVKNMGQVLPLQTQILFFVSDLLVAWWYLALLLPAMAAFGVRFLLHHNPLARVRFDGIKLRLPLLGSILRKIVLARFANTFALLYSSGIPILESIRTTQDVVGNLVVRTVRGSGIITSTLLPNRADLGEPNFRRHYNYFRNRGSRQPDERVASSPCHPFTLSFFPVVRKRQSTLHDRVNRLVQDVHAIFDLGRRQSCVAEH